MSKYNVYGLGNALVDMEFQVDDAFLKVNGIEKGVMTLVDENRQHELINLLDAFEGKKASGGSAANTLIAVNCLGGSAFYSCKVADDELGKFYLHDLSEAGISTNLQQSHAEDVTGKCLVLITPDAERSMHTFLGVSSELSTAEISEEHIKESDYCYLEGYLVTSPSAQQANISARDIARQNGVKVALTFSDPFIVQNFGDAFTQIIEDGIDLLFCNEAEALAYTQKNSIDDAIDVIKTFASSFAITLGKNGAVVYDGSTLFEIEPFATTAIDTNGAGDMFAGAYLFGITNGYPPRIAGKIASQASSKVVSQYGPRLEIHEYKKILDEIVNIKFN